MNNRLPRYRATCSSCGITSDFSEDDVKGVSSEIGQQVAYKFQCPSCQVIFAVSSAFVDPLPGPISAEPNRVLP